MEPSYVALSQSELDIIGAQIIAEETAGLTCSEPPSFYLVGAQPGSGKTEIIKLLGRQTDKNLLVCNADDFRERHPMAAKILQEHESSYPDLTWYCADHWNTQLKEYGMANHLNILVETTLQNFDLVNRQFEKMKAKGYRTNLHVLAVPQIASWMGTKIRFENEKAATGYARQVSDTAHDERFEKLQLNLPRLLQCPYIDEVRLYKRKDTVNCSAGAALDQLTQSKDDLLETYYATVQQELTLLVKAEYYQTGAKIEMLMKNRNAPRQEIDQFKNRLERYLQ